MELIIENLVVYGNKVIGSRRYKKDIMLAFTHEDDNSRVHDMFLTTAQAEKLIKDLQATLEWNKEDNEQFR